MTHITIVGNGAAGISAAKTIRRYDAKIPIRIFSKEPHPHYTPVFLSDIVCGKAEEAKLKPFEESFYEKYNIEGAFRSEVFSVNPDSKTIETRDGDDTEEIEYSKLLIATGASPFVPPVGGTDSKGVYTFSRLDDARNILNWLQNGDIESCVVVGASFIGLEIAEALAELGLEVQMLELLDKVLPRLLDVKSSKIVREKIENAGVKVHLETGIEKIVGDPVGSVKADGEEITCDLVVMATGVKPNIELVRESKIETDEGILVDEKMKTSKGEVYAAGDVAEAFNIFGERAVCPTWSSAVAQGKVAGSNMVGRNRVYEGDLRHNHVDVFGSRIVSVGRTPVEEKAQKLEIIRRERNGTVRIGIFDSDRLVGFTGVGSTAAIEECGVLSALIKKGMRINDKESVLKKGFSYENILREVGKIIPR